MSEAGERLVDGSLARQRERRRGCGGGGSGESPASSKGFLCCGKRGDSAVHVPPETEENNKRLRGRTSIWLQTQVELDCISRQLGFLKSFCRSCNCC